jgi:hypothetical protein
MPKLSESSQPAKTNPRGTLLKLIHSPSGLSRVVLDNGFADTVTVHCRAEDAHILLDSNLPAIVEHLMTRKPGHFRWK